MKKILFLFLIVFNFHAFAQTMEQKDSLVNEICKTIIASNNYPDSLQLGIAFQKHLFPFMAKYPEDKKKEIWESVYFRLQRNCKEFKAIIDKMEPQQGDWKQLKKIPKTKLKDPVCKQITTYKRLAYLEHNGDSVIVEIKDGFWIDHFKDGTYSKLYFKWINDCEFEIEFVESNNGTRKNFSKPGEKYKYLIADKHKNYYDMVVEPSEKESKVIMSFKIYFE
ncbi:MAG: hypothetical protein IPP64_08310 [Bacteroidetes bacterium]|nr:hypothetical protein [Bacteroidota bacterium]